jgi:hypothetical protein
LTTKHREASTTVDEVRRRLRSARAGIAADASIKLAGQARATTPDAIARPGPNREAAPPARVIACEQCRRRGSTFESRHRAD